MKIKKNFYVMAVQRPASSKLTEGRNGSTVTKVKRPRFLYYALINDEGEVVNTSLTPNACARNSWGKKLCFTGCPRLGERYGKGEIAELTNTRRAMIKASIREIDADLNKDQPQVCYPGWSQGKYVLVAESGHDNLPKKVVWEGTTIGGLKERAATEKVEPFPLEMVMPAFYQGQKIEVSPLPYREQAEIFQKT